MAVNDKQKSYLRGLAHALKPVVMVGNKGLTDTVLAEVENALNHHELIKVKVSGAEKDDRLKLVSTISDSTSAHLITTIGHISVFYRMSKEAKIKIPK